MHETPAVDDQGHRFSINNSSHSSVALSYRLLPKRESPSICVHHHPRQKPIRVCTPQDPGCLQERLQSEKKNGDCVFRKRQFCLCRPDVYTTACRLETDAAWSWRMLSMHTIMLVSFQLLTWKKKPKRWVPAQQGGPAWTVEMIRRFH